VSEVLPPEDQAIAAPTPGADESAGQWRLSSALWMLLLWTATQVAAVTMVIAILVLTHPSILMGMVQQGMRDHRALAAFADLLDAAVRDGRVAAAFTLAADLSFLLLAYAIWLAPRGRGVRQSIALVRSRFSPWLAIPVALAVGVLLDGLSVLAEKPVVPPELRSWFATPAGAAAIMVCLVSLVPFTEEAYFRGVLYGALDRRVGVAGAVAITSVLFAVVHFGTYGVNWLVVVQTLVIGVMLGIMRARAGSIWPCIMAHAAVNLVAGAEAIASHFLPL